MWQPEKQAATGLIRPSFVTYCVRGRSGSLCTEPLLVTNNRRGKASGEILDFLQIKIDEDPSD
jgi:hypothetical protein